MAAPPLPVDLPYETTLKDGLRARFERLSERTVDAALDVLTTAAAKGDGISQEEVPSRADLLTPPPHMATCVAVNPDDESVIAIFIRTHSPLCRSTRPLYCAGPTIANERYRGKGIGFGLMKHLKYFNFGPKVYRGFLGGATLTSPTRLKYKFTGGCNIGLVPSCTYLTGKGIIDDVIGYHDPDRHAFQASWTKEMEPVLPFLVRRTPLPEPLRSQLQPLPNFRCPEIPFRSGMLRSTLADEEDMWRVEELIRACADRGDGFGLDEFTDNGYFNRALLRESHVVVFKAPGGAVAAAVMFGASALCRSREARTVGGYIVVARDFRNKGLGRSILKSCIENTRALGYTAILSDVFVHNEKATRLLRREGFLITATLLNVALVKDRGYTDSYLMWKRIKDNPDRTALPSKI